MRRWLPAWLVLCGCAGAPAPDAAVCRDVVARLCSSPRCSSVDSQLRVGDDCETSLYGRTHCDADDFAFSTPNRTRWLECRAVLVRTSGVAATNPDCNDVASLWSRCPDVGQFLGVAP